MTMFRKFIFWPLPKAPGGRGQKIVPVHVHVEFSEKKFWPPAPHGTPKSHPWACPRRSNENPIWYVLYLLFVRRYTKFGLKIFEIDFVIQIYWYLTLWPLSKAPRGGDPKNGASVCAIHETNSHTKSGWISEEFFFLPPPPPPPQPPTVPPSPTTCWIADECVEWLSDYWSGSINNR